MARKQKTDKEIVVSTGGAAAAPRRKAVTTTRAKHSLTQAEAPVSSSVAVPTPELAPAASPEPSFEQISMLAYSYWVSRGYQGGSPEEDWLRAEQELRAALVSA